MTYSFRNRFRLPENYRVDTEVHRYPLVDSADEKVALVAGTREGKISESTDLAVGGSGYVDEAAAAAAGKKRRQVLTVALAREHIGVNFGPDDQLTPDEGLITEPPVEPLKSLGIEVGDRVIWDDFRLLVYKSEPQPKFLLLSPGTPIVLSGFEGFERNLNDAREPNERLWSREKTLAYQLVHAALRDNNPETQHIQLVTAIEVIIAENDRSQPIKDALDDLLSEVDNWPESKADVKKRLTEILELAKIESIIRAGAEQIGAMLGGKYDGTTPAAFFKHVYNMRSGLVHREKRKRRRPTHDDLRNIHAELWRFVLDLLDAYESSRGC